MADGSIIGTSHDVLKLLKTSQKCTFQKNGHGPLNTVAFFLTFQNFTYGLHGAHNGILVVQGVPKKPKNY